MNTFAPGEYTPLDELSYEEIADLVDAVTAQGIVVVNKAPIDPVGWIFGQCPINGKYGFVRMQSVQEKMDASDDDWIDARTM